MEYIAIKVKGLNHWLWFEVEKVKREYGTFVGKGGWGKDGGNTDITVNENEITGEMHSDTLQYR
jgi:hypothetical protein